MRQQMSRPRPVPLPTGLVMEKGSRTWAAALGDAGAVVADLDQHPVAVAGGAHAQLVAAVHAGRM
jgi:hypothetical protein